MRYHKKLLEVWREFWTEVDRGDGFIVQVCGLCGNSGWVNTLGSAKLGDNFCGIEGFCICPNGRAMQRQMKKKPPGTDAKRVS